jgi:hypothetical protein
MTLRELLNERSSAEISCAVTGRVVRNLTLAGDYVDLRTVDGTTVAILADETLVYEASRAEHARREGLDRWISWFMDRGSVLVKSCDQGVIKLCTEFDLVALEDGVVCTLAFVNDALKRRVLTEVRS